MKPLRSVLMQSRRSLFPRHPILQEVPEQDLESSIDTQSDYRQQDGLIECAEIAQPTSEQPQLSELEGHTSPYQYTSVS